MPAYSFKERFVPMVIDGTKRQTIRGFRNHPVKAGQYAHLYYGMRTKHCRKLREPEAIQQVKSIFITPSEDIYILETNWIAPLDRNGLGQGIFPCKYKRLGTLDKDILAHADGFRHPENPGKIKGCFQLMVAWWKETYEVLHFVGNIIYW